MPPLGQRSPERITGAEMACLLSACSGWVRRVGLRWSRLGGALLDVLGRGSRQGDEVFLSHGVKADLEWQVQLDDPSVVLSVSGVRMEDFPIRAAAVKPQDAFMRIVVCETRFHHPAYDPSGISRVAAGLVIPKRRRNAFVKRHVASHDFRFVEHGLLRDVRRPLIPVRVVVIEPDGQDGSCADIGAAPAKAGGAKEFQANVEIRVFHEVSLQSPHGSHVGAAFIGEAQHDGTTLCLLQKLVRRIASQRLLRILEPVHDPFGGIEGGLLGVL